MKTKTNNTDVIELAEEIPLEQVIENTLMKANITDKVLAELKERYGNVRLKSIDDKESYLECKAASKDIRKVEILIERLCEHGRSDAIKIQRIWISKQKELLTITGETKNPIDEDVNSFDNEVKRKEQEEEKHREEKWITRQFTLSRMGAAYDNGSFVLNHISYELELLKQVDDDQWNDTILPKYKKVYEEIEAGRVNEENKRKAEIEQQKKEREDFEAKQKEFMVQQELFAKQQVELQKQKDEADRKERLVQEQKENEERQKRQTVINDRVNQLRSLGLNYSAQYDSYVFEDTAISRVVEIEGMDNEKWNELIIKITPGIEKNKKELEEKRIAKNEEEIQVAIQKTLEDVENKKRELEAKHLQELDIASDKEKYADVVKYLKNTPTHAMKSNIYKGRMNIIADFIQDL